MNAAKEQWKYGDGEYVWTGKYLNSQNLLHWHNDCELVFVERGSLDITIDGKCYNLKRGNAAFMDSRVLHMISAHECDALLQTIIFDNKLIADFSDYMELESPVILGGGAVDSAYSELFSELTQKPALYAVSTAATVRKLMAEIFRANPTVQKKSSVSDEKLKALFNELKENYYYYTLDDAAKFMNMNASYLSRIFAEKTGMHFMRYLNCLRVSKAVELIESESLSMTDIATRCGFGTIRNFNGIFKKLTGHAPTKLPKRFVFVAPVDESSGHVNPTLNGCKLIEKSS